MTDQNPENEGVQEQNTQPSQQQPPVIPQQVAQPQESSQPQGQPQYKSQSQYQGQPNYGQNSNYGGASLQDKPNNYMAMNIVATIVGFLCGGCCIQGIIGIVGIVFSSQVDSKFNQGDLNGAISSAQTAKTIGIVSLVLTGLAFIGGIIYFIVVISAVGMDSFMDSYMDALDQAR